MAYDADATLTSKGRLLFPPEFVNGWGSGLATDCDFIWRIQEI